MKIAHESIDKFLNNIATKPCTPAGGCTAALCAASVTALMEMVARHTIDNKDKSKKVIDYMEEIIQISSIYRQRFLEDMDRDVEAYEDVINAQKDDKDNIDEYYKISVNIPLEMVYRVLNMMNMVKKVIKDGSDALLTDSVAALLISNITLISLIYHIKFNLIYIKDKDFVDKIEAELELIETQIQ